MYIPTRSFKMKLSGLKNKVSKKPSTFVKFLISYLIVLVIPIVAITVVYNNFIVRVIKEEAVTNAIEMLNFSRIKMDVELQQIHGISFRLMYTNRNLSNYFAMDTIIGRNNRIRSELYYSIFTNLIVSEVALYNRYDQIMYTSRGHFSIHDFFYRFYRFADYNSTMFLEDINTINRIHFIPAQNVNENQRYIALLYPSHSFALWPRPALMFLIDEERFLRNLNRSERIEGFNAIVLDENANVIAAINHNEHITSELFRADVMAMGSETHTIININGEDYLVFVSRSTPFSIKYVSMFPVASIFERVNNMHTVMLAVLSFVVLVGAVIVFCAMYLNYMPLNRLSTNLKSLFVLKEEQNSDEVDTVKQAIGYLSDENAKLTVKLGDRMQQVQDSAILSILRGESIVGDLSEFLYDIGLSFKFNNFCIALVHTPKNLMRQSLKTAIDAEFTDGMASFCCESITKNQFIVVINLPEIGDNELINLLDRARVRILQEESITITIGMGYIVDSLQDLPRSFNGAQIALTNRFFVGNESVIDVNSLANDMNYSSLHPKNEADALLGLIKKHNIPKIKSHLKKLCSHIKGAHMPIFLVRAFCFELINAIILANNDYVNIAGQIPNIFSIEKIDTIDELFEIITQACVSCTEGVQKELLEEPKDEAGNRIEKIKQFISENYTNMDFSIMSVSDKFGMKLPYLSAYFKTNTGKTLIDYVTELRINKARNLLKSTDLTLNAISEQVGYYNTSSFIRRFKQIMAMTPGEYRKQAMSTPNA